VGKRTKIGLDIGSSAVRAAEVTLDGDKSQLVRFAQVGLPAGAVVEGEIRDQAEVAAALKRLWAEGGFRRRDVVLGISSQRAMVRVIEVPALSEKELRPALRYQIGELLPIPVEQAVYDFTTLGPGRPKDGGEPKTEVLVVVAQKDIVWDAIGVAKRAGLRVRAVDASPLALLRAVPPADQVNTQSLDAVVSVGAHLLVVALRQGSTPRFMRTATLTTDAEANAKAASPVGARLGPAASREKGEPRPGPAKVEVVIEEVRSSIEYFLSHAHDAHLDRVQLTGGGALAQGLAARLASVLGVPVVPAEVLPTCERTLIGLDEGQFREASERWTTAVGLGLWGGGVAHAPNLLPVEIEQKRRERAQMIAAASGVVLVAGALGLLSHGRDDAISSANRQVAVYQQEAAQVEAQISKMTSFAEVSNDIQARRALAAEALSDDIDWVGLQQRVHNALPAGVTITELSFASTSAQPGTSAQTGYIGTVSISANTVGGLPSEERFIDKMSTVRGLAAVWIATTQSSVSQPGKPSAGMSFSASAEVTPAALSNRAAQLPGSTK